MTPLTEEHIWEVLDGEASYEVLVQHEAQLLTDETYRTAFVQCQRLHRQLLCLPLEAPSMRFTENLIERLAPEKRVAPKRDRLPAIFMTIFLVLSILFVTLLISMGNTAPVASNGLTIEGVIEGLSNPLFIQGFMILNFVLIFAVLDKKVLKPYFDNRR